MIAAQAAPRDEPQEAPETGSTLIPKYTEENLPREFFTLDEDREQIRIVLNKKSEGGLFVNIYGAKGQIEYMGRSDITLYYLHNIMQGHFSYSKEIVAAAKVLQEDGILDEKYRSTQYGRYDPRKDQYGPRIEDYKKHKREQEEGQEEEPTRPVVVRGGREAAGLQKPAPPFDALNAA